MIQRDNKISNYERMRDAAAAAFLSYDQEKMIRKFSLSHDENALYLEFVARLHRIGCPVRFTLLPFRAVGTAAGLLLAARSDYIEVNGRRYPRTPVALSEQPVSDGGGYHALWGAAEERGRGHEAVDVAEAAVAQSAKAG